MLGGRTKASQHIADGVISVAFEAFSRDFERHHRYRGDHGADNDVCEGAGILIAPNGRLLRTSSEGGLCSKTEIR